MSEAKPNRVQGMVRSIDQYRNGDAKAICAGSPAQVFHAVSDARNDVLALWGALETAAAEIAKLRNALYECEEYFDNRADADHDETGFVPNEEMKLLHAVRDALLGGTDA